MFHVEQLKNLLVIMQARLELAKLSIYWLAILFALSGCKSPEPNPENRDPIFLDLKSKKESAEKGFLDQQKKVDAARAVAKEIAARDPKRKRKMADLYAQERILRSLEQEMTYYRHRVEQRKAYAKKQYLKAFYEDREWPPNNEMQEYKRRQELRAAERNWDARVPKLTRHLRQPPKGQESNKKPEDK
jgi:hypothetical protein